MENNFEKENEQIIAQNDVAEQQAEPAVDEPVDTAEQAEPASEAVAEAPAKSKKFPWWIVAVAAVVVAAIVTVAVLLTPKYADYSVTVVDEIGNPMSNVMVKFTDTEGVTKTRITDKDGKVAFPEVLVGEISVKLDKALSTAKILVDTYTLDKKTTELCAVVCDESKTQDIYGDVDEGTYAYVVGTGVYNLPAYEAGIVYLVFHAQEPGTYKVSLSSSNPDVTVAYHGIPMFVQSGHRGESAYDGKSFDLVIYDVATPYVIGVNRTTECEATLTVERTGDAPFDPQYEPWTEVFAKEQFGNFKTTSVTPLDISDSNLSVTLGDDGYYYTNEGKLVYVMLTKPSNYLDVSIAFICGFEDENIGNNFGGYVYDDNGEFVNKFTYNTMIGTYVDHCDSNGVYPLTAELAEAIKCHGNSTGWWKPGTANFLFTGKPFVQENAWLFLCYTAD